MLEFCHDFLDKCFSRQDLELCYMDTDLFYLEMTGYSLDEIVRPEMKQAFEADKKNWLTTDKFSERSQILTRLRMWALGSMIKALWHTSKTSSHYLPITISVMSWLMVFIQGRWIFKPSNKDVFHNHWKVMKTFTQSV